VNNFPSSFWRAENELREELSQPLPNPKVIIKKIKENRHPCFGQHGLFAAVPLQKGETISNYVGLVSKVSKKLFNPSKYVISMYEENGIMLDIDAERIGNETRFLNDYHGIIEEPNVELQVDNDTLTGDIHCFAIALHEIQVGEELLMDYGEGYWDIISPSKGNKITKLKQKYQVPESKMQKAETLRFEIKQWSEWTEKIQENLEELDDPGDIADIISTSFKLYKTALERIKTIHTPHTD